MSHVGLSPSNALGSGPMTAPTIWFGCYNKRCLGRVCYCSLELLWKSSCNKYIIMNLLKETLFTHLSNVAPSVYLVSKSIFSQCHIDLQAEYTLMLLQKHTIKIKNNWRRKSHCKSHLILNSRRKKNSALFSLII